MLVPRSSTEDAGPSRTRLILPRASNSTGSDDGGSGMSSGAKTGVIVVAIIVVVSIVLSLSLYVLARILRSRNAQPKYIPTQTLKNRWRRWASISYKNRGHYSEQQDSDLPSLRPVPRSGRGSAINSRSVSPALEQLRTRDSASTHNNANASSATVGATVEREIETGTRGTPADNQTAVDRHTSVRSIMTLPAYTPAAGDEEQILGREGDRAGIDVVLEYPETIDEVEQRREDEMESLYQIRRARRTEAAEREERRRLRREARARGDWAEVERLRLEAREAQERRERELLGNDPDGERSAARLIAEHQEEQQRRERQRRVSSVQYAELGVARHDGSRVRASSNASARSEDNRPLLDSAADMGGEAAAGGRRGTLSTIDTLSVHHRNRSTSSVFSLSSNEADDAESGYHPPFAPPLSAGHSRGRSGSGSILTTDTSSPDFEVVSLHSNPPERSTTPRPHSRAPSASRLAHSVTTDSLPRISTETPFPEFNSSVTSPSPDTAPPHYEHLAATAFGEPPQYESPVAQRAPQLPSLERLPSIRVEEARSPGGAAASSAEGASQSTEMSER